MTKRPLYLALASAPLLACSPHQANGPQEVPAAWAEAGEKGRWVTLRTGAGAPAVDLNSLAIVTELRDRGSDSYRGVTFSSGDNSHYSFVPASGLAERFGLLS